MNELTQQQVLPGTEENLLDMDLVRAKQKLKRRFDAEMAEHGKARDWLTGKMSYRYRRTIHKIMARWLIALYNYNALHTGRWAPLDNLPTQKGGDYGKLALWGLIVMPVNEKRGDGSNRVGYFKITPKGREFVEGKIGLPKYAYTVEGRLTGFTGSNVYIHEIIEGFDYQEIMK